MLINIKWDIFKREPKIKRVFYRDGKYTYDRIQLCYKLDAFQC